MKYCFKLFVYLLVACVFLVSSTTVFSAEKYILLSQKQNRNQNKVWTINFNTPLDKNTIEDKNIWISDSKGNKAETILALTEDLKSVRVSLVKGSYNLNESYLLNIENTCI